MPKELIAALLERGDRTSKPRTNGITIALDVGGLLGPRAIADFADIAGPHCDYVKIAWGSSLITEKLEAKLAAYRDRGITPLLGGTLFEYCWLRGTVPKLVELVRALGVEVEISDGVIDLPRREKLRWIETFARHGQVFSEVGGKIERQSHDWKLAIAEELAAGSKKVVVEGRELGPVGQDIRLDFLETVLAATPLENLVFEALERKQQVFLIKRLGANVNLANIRPEDLLTLESFRLGLKEHTLLHVWERSRKT
jgi:phosphosulfolactate synthase